MSEFDQVKDLLGKLTADQRREIFLLLRKEFPLHPLETELNAQAEVILEAIHKSSDLTLRGIRGVIAQAAFEVNIASRLRGWQVVPIKGDPPYDSHLRDANGDVTFKSKCSDSRNTDP